MLSRTLMTTAMLGACGIGGLAAQEVEIHGFASIGYLSSSDNNYLVDSEDGSFEFNEVGINFRVEIDEKTSAGVQFFSRDLGPLGNNDISVDWAFLDHSVNDQLGVRVGRVKLPGALYNEYQDIDAVRGTILMPQGIYNLNFRDTTVGVDGVALYGNLATESAGDFDYNLFYGVLPIKNDGSVAREFKYIASGSVLDDFESNLEYCYGGNFVWNTPLEGLRVGLAYQDLVEWEISGNIYQMSDLGFLPSPVVRVYSAAEFEMDSLSIFTVSTEYTYDTWVFTAEWQEYDGTIESNLGPDTDINWLSWYIQASYELNEKWMFTAYYMDWVDDPDDDDDESEYQRDLTFAVRYNVNESWNLKAEIHSMDGYGLTKSIDNPDGREDSWTLFAIKSTVSF